MNRIARSFLCCVPFVALHATRGCAGAAALAFNGAFNLALLFLFADFHRRSYGRGAGRRQVGGVAAAPRMRHQTAASERSCPRINGAADSTSDSLSAAPARGAR